MSCPTSIFEIATKNMSDLAGFSGRRQGHSEIWWPHTKKRKYETSELNLELCLISTHCAQYKERRRRKKSDGGVNQVRGCFLRLHVCMVKIHDEEGGKYKKAVKNYGPLTSEQ